MGSSDTDVNALAVIPCTSPSRSTVITVTPVAKCPRAFLNSACVNVDGASAMNPLEMELEPLRPLPFLPRHTQGQLNLTWVKDRAGSAVRRVGGTFHIKGSRTAVSDSTCR